MIWVKKSETDIS